jgi:hypothetical protein
VVSTSPERKIAACCDPWVTSDRRASPSTFEGDEHYGDGDCHAVTVGAPTRRVLLRS